MRLTTTAGLAGIMLLFAAGAFAAPAPTNIKEGTATPAEKATTPAPEIGAVSRSTGHLFREGLAAGIAADRAGSKPSAIKSNNQGLLTDAADGALTSDLWKGMTASDLAAGLRMITPNPNFPVMMSLARRMLLTDAPWPEGDDLRALRLEKMMSFGASEQAARLYTFWSPETPLLSLLQAGTTALMRTGRPSVACLDITVHQDLWEKHKDDLPYFPAMMQACSAWMAGGGTAHPDVAGPYDLREDLSMGVAAPPHILAQADSLYAQAKSGAVDSAFLAAFAKISRGLPPQTLSLFAPAFEKISTTLSASLDESVAVASVLALTGSPKAEDWIQKVKTQLPTPATPHLAAGSLILLGKMAGFEGLDGPIPIKFATLKEEKKTQAIKILKILSELLDKRPDFIDTPVVVYEKKTDLTSASRYVMHWRELQNNLRSAQKNGQIGRLVLTSLLITQADKPGNMDPDALAMILKSMMAAGLKEEACQIAATVLLGDLQTGE